MNNAQSVVVCDVPEVDDAGAPLPELTARSIGELLPRPNPDPDELIRHRFLCRGGAALIAAPSGIGKSVITMQAGLCFAVGRDCLGLQPARPLKSLLIQAEDDEGDLLEQRDGILAGLDYSEAQRALAFENFLFRTVDDQCGPDFIEKTVAPLCEKYSPDIVMINPLLAYLGGDVSRQETVGPFLRNALNPVLHRHGAACILVHHTNKPATGKEKPNFQAGDYAYVGAGSADLANWARAVIAIRSIGDHSVYELHLGKRGQRAGWKDDDGTTCYSKLIAHGTDGIYWREAPEDERPVAGGRATEHTVEDIVAHLDTDLTNSAWAARCKDESGISARTFYRLKKAAIGMKLVTQSKVNSHWFKA